MDKDFFVYSYHRTNSNGTKLSWRCERRSDCKVTLLTNKDGKVLRQTNQHSHTSSSTYVVAKKKLSALKTSVISAPTTSRMAISELAESCDRSVMSELPSIASISRNIRKWKQIKEKIPPNPSSRTGFHIPNEFKTLDNGENFLLFDSGPEDEQRILIFGTQKGLNDLESCQQWACDGTFKCSPGIYYQLWSLHIQMKSFSVPRLFALLPNICFYSFRDVLLM